MLHNNNNNKNKKSIEVKLIGISLGFKFTS